MLVKYLQISYILSKHYCVIAILYRSGQWIDTITLYYEGLEAFLMYSFLIWYLAKEREFINMKPLSCSNWQKIKTHQCLIGFPSAISYSHAVLPVGVMVGPWVSSNATLPLDIVVDPCVPCKM